MLPHLHSPVGLMQTVAAATRLTALRATQMELHLHNPAQEEHVLPHLHSPAGEVQAMAVGVQMELLARPQPCQGVPRK